MKRWRIRLVFWLLQLDGMLAIEWVPDSISGILARPMFPLWRIAEREWRKQGCDNCVTDYRKCNWPKGECAGFMSMFDKHEGETKKETG